MQLPFLNEGLTRLRALRSHFDLAALTAPSIAAGIVRTGTGLCLARLQRAKKNIIATHADYIALSPEAGPEEIATVVVERLKAWGGVECASFGLDYNATILRSFSFPFGGQRQIKAVLPNEFAENSLLPMQEYCLAQSHPLLGSDEKFNVTAAAANRKDALALARAFSMRGVRLRNLSPVWSALPFAWQNSSAKDQEVCFVDLDHAREAYVLLNDGSVSYMICLPTGDGGIDQLAGRIAFFVEQAGSVERIIISGNEVDEVLMMQLEDKLSLPVEKPQLRQSIDMSAVGTEKERFALAATLAASLLLPRPKTEMNFLTEDMVPDKEIPEWQNTALKICIAACFVVASLCVLDVVRGLREQGAIRPLQQELFRNYREAMSDVPPTTSIAQMQRIMDSRLREWHMAEQVEAETKGGTAIDILTAMHKTLTPNMQGVADAITLSRGNFTLSGSVSDFKLADMIREKLAAQTLFTEVQLKNVQRSGQQSVSYEIEGKIRLPAN